VGFQGRKERDNSPSHRIFNAIRFNHHKGEGVWGWNEVYNPVASIDTGIKRSTTETQVNGGHYSLVYISEYTAV
jgi:hypothetical protein